MRSASSQLYTIAHILPWPAVGGTELATLRIAQAIDGSRFASVAFYLSGADSVRTLFVDAGFRSVPYVPAVPSYRHVARFISQSLELSRELKRQKVDLVHCADLPAAHAAALAGWLARIPVLCHIRNRFDRISRRDCSFLWPVSKFVFVSEDTWRRFSCRVAGSRGTVVYDGLDVPGRCDVVGNRESVRAEFGIPADAPIIGMIARVAPQKDFPTLVRAAAQVLQVEPRARFLIAGDHASHQRYRETYQQVRQMLADYGVVHAFMFAGHRQDVPRLLDALDMFVLSTHWEGLPLVILEAMAHEKPVVATAVDGIPEILSHGETGLSFPHEDHRKLADHLIWLLQDRAGASRLGEAGRNLVQSRFSRQQFGGNMSALYSDLLRGRVRSV